MFFCAVSLLDQSAIAQAPQWQVQPTICISEQAGQSCEFTVEITLLNLPSAQYCLVLTDKLIRCANLAEFPLKIPISISKTSQLLLLNEAQQTLLSTTLLVKSRQASTQRRRLRNPWSLF